MGISNRELKAALCRDVKVSAHIAGISNRELKEGVGDNGPVSLGGISNRELKDIQTSPVARDHAYARISNRELKVLTRVFVKRG